MCGGFEHEAVVRGKLQHAYASETDAVDGRISAHHSAVDSEVSFVYVFGRNYPAIDA